MPESVKNRPTSATEEIFMFAKSPSYYYNPHGIREESDANLRNFWVLPQDPGRHGHPATYPRELVRRCILLGSREGDTILDPFGGSDTTGIVASEYHRNSIMIELNFSYVEINRERAATIQPQFQSFTTGTTT